MKLDMFNIYDDDGITIEAKQFRFQGTGIEALPYRVDPGDLWTPIAVLDGDWRCLLAGHTGAYTDLTFYDGPRQCTHWTSPVIRLEGDR